MVATNGRQNARRMVIAMRFMSSCEKPAPGDILLSFKDTLIQAVGVATDFCFEAPKPKAFGDTGKNWSRIGWKVPVHWDRLVNRIRPSEHMDQLSPLLPEKYAPLRHNGHGLQAVYLAAVPEPMAMMLATLIGPPQSEIIRGRAI